MLIQGHEIRTKNSSYVGMPPKTLVFLSLLGAEIAGGALYAPLPRRVILRPSPARVLKNGCQLASLVATKALKNNLAVYTSL